MASRVRSIADDWDPRLMRVVDRERGRDGSSGASGWTEGAVRALRPPVRCARRGCERVFRRCAHTRVRERETLCPDHAEPEPARGTRRSTLGGVDASDDDDDARDADAEVARRGLKPFVLVDPGSADDDAAGASRGGRRSRASALACRVCGLVARAHRRPGGARDPSPSSPSHSSATPNASASWSPRCDCASRWAVAMGDVAFRMCVRCLRYLELERFDRPSTDPDPGPHRTCARCARGRGGGGDPATTRGLRREDDDASAPRPRTRLRTRGASNASNASNATLRPDVDRTSVDRATLRRLAAEAETRADEAAEGAGGGGGGRALSPRSSRRKNQRRGATSASGMFSDSRREDEFGDDAEASRDASASARRFGLCAVKVPLDAVPLRALASPGARAALVNAAAGTFGDDDDEEGERGERGGSRGGGSGGGGSGVGPSGFGGVSFSSANDDAGPAVGDRPEGATTRTRASAFGWSSDAALAMAFIPADPAATDGSGEWVPAFDAVAAPSSRADRAVRAPRDLVGARFGYCALASEGRASSSGDDDDDDDDLRPNVERPSNDDARCVILACDAVDAPEEALSRRDPRRAAERAFFGPEGPGVGSRASTRVPARSKVGRSVFSPDASDHDASDLPAALVAAVRAGRRVACAAGGELFEAKAVRSVNSVSPDEEDRRSVFSPDDDDRTRRRNAESSVRLVPVPGASAREGFHRGAFPPGAFAFDEEEHGAFADVTEDGGAFFTAATRLKCVYTGSNAAKIRRVRLRLRPPGVPGLGDATEVRCRHAGGFLPTRVVYEYERDPGAALGSFLDAAIETVRRWFGFGASARRRTSRGTTAGGTPPTTTPPRRRRLGRAVAIEVDASAPAPDCVPLEGVAFVETVVRSGPFAGLPVGAPGVALLLTSDPEAFAELDGVLEKKFSGDAFIRTRDAAAASTDLRPTVDDLHGLVSIASVLAERVSTRRMARRAVCAASDASERRCLGALLGAYAHVPTIDARLAETAERAFAERLRHADERVALDAANDRLALDAFERGDWEDLRRSTFLSSNPREEDESAFVASSSAESSRDSIWFAARAGGEEAMADDRYVARRYAPRALRDPDPGDPPGGHEGDNLNWGAFDDEDDDRRRRPSDDDLRTTFERTSWNNRGGPTTGFRASMAALRFRTGSFFLRRRRVRRGGPERGGPPHQSQNPSPRDAGDNTNAIGFEDELGPPSRTVNTRPDHRLRDDDAHAAVLRHVDAGTLVLLTTFARAFDRRLWSHYLRLCLLFACYRYRVAVWNAGSERVRDAAGALERSGYSSVAARRQLVTSLATARMRHAFGMLLDLIPGSFLAPEWFDEHYSRPYAFRALACGLVDENGGLVGASKTPAARAHSWITHAAIVAVTKMVMNAKMIRLSGATEVRVRATSALFMPSFAALHFIVVHGPFFVRHWAVGRARLLGAMRENDDGGLGASDLDAMTKNWVIFAAIDSIVGAALVVVIVFAQHAWRRDGGEGAFRWWMMPLSYSYALGQGE